MKEDKILRLEARTREFGASRKYLEQKQKKAQGFTPGKEEVLGWGQTRRRERKTPCINE